MLNFSDPTLEDLINQDSEEYYGSLIGYTDDFDDLDNEEECPDWVMEQIDEELPF